MRQRARGDLVKVAEGGGALQGHSQFKLGGLLCFDINKNKNLMRLISNLGTSVSGVKD